MSQNDKPKLDELQKLLRRLERVESDKAEIPSIEDAPTTASETATSDAPRLSATKTLPNNSANASTANGPVSVGANGARLGPASAENNTTSDADAGTRPGDPPFVKKLQSGLGTPPQPQSGTGHQSTPAATAKEAEGIGDSAKPATDGTPFDSKNATSKPGASGGDKQHLARMVYRGTARDLPLQDGVPGSNRSPEKGQDQPPFQLPALPDSRSREISEGVDEKARSGSSIGVVLVAAITAAVVSTVAAVLITIWVIRGGGFGGQNDPVLSASRTTSTIADSRSNAVAAADSTGANSIGTSPTAATSIEPPAADPPPEAAKVSPDGPVDSAGSEISSPLGDERETAVVSPAQPADAEAAAQKIAAAIASDQPLPDEQAIRSGAPAQADPTAVDTSSEPTVSEIQDGTSAPVDLAAITNTAPEPDKSEMVSAVPAGDTQPDAFSSSASTSDGAIATVDTNDAAATSASSANGPEASRQPSDDPSNNAEPIAGLQPSAQVPTGKAGEPLSPPLEGPDNPEIATTERSADNAAVGNAEPASPSEAARSSSASDALVTEAGGSGVDEPATTSLNAVADTSSATISGPAALRGDALAFNDTSSNNEAPQTEQAAKPEDRAASQPSDPATASEADSAAAVAPPKPRAPYALNNPTQLKITPDVSFEFPLRIEAPATANLDNHFLIVSGLKRGARFSQGVELMFDTWQVQANNLDQLRLTIPAGFARELPLTIELRRPDGMSVVRNKLLLTASGSVERLSLPAALFEKEGEALPAAVLAKVREGERAIDNGNLRGARLALQEAALQSSAVAALLLAMSYDPRHVAKFGGSTGSNTDVAAARQWYGRASSFGAEIATPLSRGL